MSSVSHTGLQGDTQGLVPAPPWRAVYSKRFGHWIIHHHQWCERGETSTLFTIHTTLNDEKDAAVAAFVVEAVNSLAPNRALIEQQNAKLTCCCGDAVDHSPWRGHSPVSMYDHALDQANARIAELEASQPKTISLFQEGQEYQLTQVNSHDSRNVYRGDGFEVAYSDTVFRR